MAKKESTFTSMIATLSIVALVAAALLGSIYEMTKEPIRLAELEKKNRAIKAVVPDFNNEPSLEFLKYGVDGDTVVLYTAKMDGALVGTAVETFTNNGFSGHFKLMVGFDSTGTIIDVAVVSHSETPGLGDKMEQGKSDFHVQFMGKHPEDFKLMVVKDRGDVDAITATTISSRAYCEAVQRAYDAFMATGIVKN
ncbi:MAG: RnfABCDGE type electron transport complex subunit G [Bacteroidales bacterium]